MQIKEDSDNAEYSKADDTEVSLQGEESIDYELMKKNYMLDTDNQVDEILRLRKEARQLVKEYFPNASNEGYFLYQEDLVREKGDKTSKKISFDDVRNILREIPFDETQDGDNDKKLREYGDRIKQRIKELQGSADFVIDWVDCFLYYYWPDADQVENRRQEIFFDQTVPLVVFREYDEKGNVIKTETLIDGINKKFFGE